MTKRSETDSDQARTFVVVGGGVTGLFAAHALCRAARKGDRIVILEAGESLGANLSLV